MSGFQLIIKDSDTPIPDKMSVNITRLSRQTGYSISHLSRVITGETTPSVPCLEKLARALSIKLDDLHHLIREKNISSSTGGNNVKSC